MILATLLISGLNAYGYGDESGTLILIAHTKDAVILSVDSKVTSDYAPDILSELEKHPDAGTRIAPDAAKGRKLVDFGRYSSCAISGYLGLPFENLDVATAMRRYAAEHPQIEADKAIDSLLLAAAHVWNTTTAGEGGLPKNRQAGDTITSIWCGTVSSGTPTIVHGETYVARSYKAYCRKVPDSPSGGIYLGGALKTDEFIKFLENPDYGDKESDPRNVPFSRLHRGVVDDLSSNAKLAETLTQWRAQTLQSRTISRDALSQNLTELSRASLQELFKFLFSSVEKRLDHVGPPFNVRLILLCSRIETTVDAKWPSCGRKVRHK